MISMPEIIEVGDKVKFSEKALSEFQPKHRAIMEKSVYQVVEKTVTVWEGVVLHLHCGTVLYRDEAVKVDKDTPLYT